MEEEIWRFLRNFKQHHILEHLHKLGEEKRKYLLQDLKKADLNLTFRLHEEFSRKQDSSPLECRVEPAPIFTIDRTDRQRRLVQEARSLGESLLRDGKVAVLIVAGGQGTRLGVEGPKGKFPISPVKGKSLFQLFAESVRALSRRYQSRIPLLIMTSEENREETEDFFASSQFFGLNREEVYFFNQGMLPTITPQGELLLKDEVHLLTHPDGHGGSLKALYQSGLVKILKHKGYYEVFYCQVDNPLVKIADPFFLGFHHKEGAEISTKVVRRKNLEEKVGIYGLVKGRPAIVEYCDFIPQEYRSLDEKGCIRHWAGNTAIHILNLSFVERLNEKGFSLPYHRAAKEVEAMEPDGGIKKLTGWKFESFIFDSIPLSRKSCCLEVVREEEFSPIKNARGIDSPETARRAMSDLFRSWLRETGAELASNVQVEVSPLFALAKEELMEKLGGENLVLSEDCYFE